LIKRDKINLDIFWLKHGSLQDSANLPDLDIIAVDCGGFGSCASAVRRDR